MRKKLFFVYNPKAGKALIRNKLADILDIFARAGYETTVAPTQKQGDAAAAVAQRRSDYDLVQWRRRHVGRGCDWNDSERFQYAYRIYPGGQHQ